MKYSEDKMWKATVDCDTKYDNKFYYAVKTVGVYCKPSCKSRTPLRKNVVFFETATDAETAGFRACKRCRPDLSEYEPIIKLAEQTKDLIDNHFNERKELAEKMKCLGVSSNHLAVLFKNQYSLSPNDYICSKRIERAKELLESTNIPIVDIAYEIGFSSVSAFYAFFKKNVGATPKEYRQKNHTY